MGENLGPLSQAGADEEKAWESRGIQGKTGQRQGLIVGTLSRQLQVSDWREEEQNRCEWKSDRGREVGSRQRSFVVGAAHRATSTESACRCPSGAGAAQDSLARTHLTLPLPMRHLPDTGFYAVQMLKSLFDSD